MNHSTAATTPSSSSGSSSGAPKRTAGSLQTTDVQGHKRRRVAKEEIDNLTDVSIDTLTKFRLQAFMRAKKISLPCVSKFTKSQMAEVVNGYLLRTDECLVDYTNRTVVRPVEYLNDKDPITLESFSKRSQRVTFMKDMPPEQNPAGTSQTRRRTHRFDPVALVSYILETGETRSPFTREKFTEADLQRLELVYVTTIRRAGPSRAEEVLRHRPDLPRAGLGRSPTRRELGLGPAEPYPQPVDDFAPWLTSQSLQQLADEVRYERDRRRYNSNVGALLRDPCEELVQTGLTIVSAHVSEGDPPRLWWRLLGCAHAVVRDRLLWRYRDYVGQTPTQALAYTRELMARLEGEVARTSGARRECLGWYRTVVLETLANALGSGHLAPPLVLTHLTSYVPLESSYAALTTLGQYLQGQLKQHSLHARVARSRTEAVQAALTMRMVRAHHQT